VSVYDVDSDEQMIPRAIQLLDAWLPDNTPGHIRKGLVRLMDLEHAVHRFVELECASLHELKKAHAGIRNVERKDNEVTELSQSWIDDFWERYTDALPPLGPFMDAVRCWAEGSQLSQPDFFNDGSLIWCKNTCSDCQIPRELWEHLEIVLGTPIPERFKTGWFVKDTRTAYELLEDFCERNGDIPCLDDIIEMAKHWAKGEESDDFINDGELIWCGDMPADCEIPAEFWTQLEALIAAPIPARFKARRFVTGG